MKYCCFFFIFNIKDLFSVPINTLKRPNSSHELTTPVADSVHVNMYLKNHFAYTEIEDISDVRYPTDF